jgi:hypothetical protein
MTISMLDYHNVRQEASLFLATLHRGSVKAGGQGKSACGEAGGTPPVVKTGALELSPPVNIGAWETFTTPSGQWR